jgi:hypothetical protein
VFPVARIAGLPRLAVLLAGIIVALSGLVVPPGASAAPAARGPARGLHISHMRPVYWAWATEAAARVPLPDARLDLYRGDATYVDELKTMYLPWAGHDSWTAQDVHGLFLHELGHVYDHTTMTPERRNAFKEAVGVECRWWARHCVTARWVSGAGVFVDLPPGEMFAEEYAACGLGLTQRGYQDAGYRSYGWVPPPGTDDSVLCALIAGGT